MTLSRQILYSVRKPEHILFDLDSTVLNTYGNQEGEGFNFHYPLYEICEENDCLCAIRLKQNSTLVKTTADADEALSFTRTHS